MLLLTPAPAVGSHVFPFTRMFPPWPPQLLSFILSIFGCSVVPIMTVSVGEAFRGTSPGTDAVRC